MNILMVAAENGALPGGKVGGMGDVLRDIPRALAAMGHVVSTVMPGYQWFSRLSGAVPVGLVDVVFRGRLEKVSLFHLTVVGEDHDQNVWILDHPGFAPCGAGAIYCDDPPESPFATDASKFALFSAAVAEALVSGRLGDCDVIHLHDWHAATVAVLARYQKRYQSLARKRLVFTIHNLGLQGVRPFAGDDSALESWFPDLKYDAGIIGDPRYPDCFNPMRAAINLCDRIHAVSPTYAAEIQRPSEPERGFYGGEGLEGDLRCASTEKRLVGILNACEYPAVREEPLDLPGFLAAAQRQLLAWVGDAREVSSCHFIASQRIADWQRREAMPFVLSSVGRLTRQKIHLFMVALDDGRTGLEQILDNLPSTAVMVVLGSGSPEIEDFMTGIAARYDNLLFLRGYSESLAAMLYGLGDLFIMPSSYEPCGISQMLAMREGQPCLVHAVGGLADTVHDHQNGFVFSGNSELEQATNMVARVTGALALQQGDPDQWASIKGNALATRFEWKEIANHYVNFLYSVDSRQP